MSVLTWKRGEFRIATRVVALQTQEGHVSSCGTWGIHDIGRAGYSLTHILTGLRVASCDRLRDAKQLAEVLSPLVAAVRLHELSDVWQIADAVNAAVRDTMLVWVRGVEIIALSGADAAWAPSAGEVAP